MVCFLDLDGVLVNFMDAANRLHGQDVMLPDWQFPTGEEGWDTPDHMGMTMEEFFGPMDFEFCKNLDWFDFGDTPEYNGQELLAYCEDTYKPENICLLTSPCLTPGGVEGKRAWIDNHMPRYKKQVLFGSCKKFCAHPDAVLFDDRDKNIREFQENFGEGILLPRPWNTLWETWYEQFGL